MTVYAKCNCDCIAHQEAILTKFFVHSINFYVIVTVCVGHSFVNLTTQFV